MRLKLIDVPIGNLEEGKLSVEIAYANYVSLRIAAGKMIRGRASGTAVTPSLVVTCSHIIHNRQESIACCDGKGNIVKLDTASDLMLIEIAPRENFSPVMRIAEDVTVEEELHNVSYALGEDGIYKKLEVAKVTSDRILAWFYAPLPPGGASGSAVYNRRGECAGIVRGFLMRPGDQAKEQLSYTGLAVIIPPWELEKFVCDGSLAAAITGVRR